MMQKQERQCFYTKKLLMLCVFLFLSLAAPENQEGAEYNTRQAEATRMEEQREVSRKIMVINRDEVVQPTSEVLRRLHGALSIRSREDLVKEHQVFQLKGNDSGYEQELDVTNDYRSILGNIERVERIEQKLQSDKECSICVEMFTDTEGEGKIFVSECNQISHIFHYNCYLKFKNTGVCPHCQRCLVDPNVEEMYTTEVLNTRKINHIENITSNRSHWKLHIRDKTYDNEILRKTRIPAKNWFIIDEPVFEANMEVLELSLDKLKDLEEDHITALKVFEFQKIKFNNDQEAREIFRVISMFRDLQLYQKGNFVFTTDQKSHGVYSIELRRENIGAKGNQISYTYQKGCSSPRRIFAFNKENIDYLKETKSVFFFVRCYLLDVYIGLKGDEIISKEDFEAIFIPNDEVGLVCDNLNNFSVMKQKKYHLLSPIDQLKIVQITEMKNNLKFPIEGNSVILTEDDCFLFPLFELSSEMRTVSFEITCYMLARECFSFNDIVKELNGLFEGVEIKGRELTVNFKDYAVILLFYFSENALKVGYLTLCASEMIGNYELNVIKDLINNQPISKQQVEELALVGELFDFAVETKIMESIKFQSLSLYSENENINDDFTGKEDGLSIIKRDLDRLMLIEYAIKYLLYFKKGINELNILYIDFSIVGNNDRGHQWLLWILDKIMGNGIMFHIPSMDSLIMPRNWYCEEIKKIVLEEIVFFGETLPPEISSSEEEKTL